MVEVGLTVLIRHASTAVLLQHHALRAGVEFEEPALDSKSQRWIRRASFGFEEPVLDSKIQRWIRRASYGFEEPLLDSKSQLWIPASK